MEEYKGSNKFVQALIKEYDGYTEYFSLLPRTAQHALWVYMRDGAWDKCKSFNAAKVEYAYEKFGYVKIPTKVLCQAIMDNFKAAKDSKDVLNWATWDEYHAWYVDCSFIPKPNDVWPVILNRYDDELLQDGWHRFHAYVIQGVKKVPCLYYVS